MQELEQLQEIEPMQSTIAVQPGASTETATIPISVGGKWFDVPVIRVNGQDIVIKGNRVKIASPHDEDWVDDELTDPEACIRACKKRRGRSRPDIFSFSQKVPDTIPRYSYTMHPRSIAVTRVGEYEEWIRELSRDCRKNITRAARRGVVIKVRGFDPDVIEGIRQVQNETPVRQGRQFTHYGKSSEEVQRDHGSFLDRCEFICAYHEDEFIGFSKIVYRGGVASLMQLLTKVSHYDKRTANALLAKVAERCADKGIHYLTYDLFNYGNRRDTTLRDFKERHGFFEMLLPCYYVPLTAWGALCLKTGLYKGLHDVIPAPVLTAVVNLRARWYERLHR